MTPLCEIAEKHKTDKCPAFGWHGYTPFYYELLKDFKCKRLLELGVGYPGDIAHIPGYQTGASLKMWRDFFPEADIVGLDVSPLAMLRGEPRIMTHLFDSRKDELPPVGGFNVIIDDGSHNPEDQLTSFEKLYHLLLPGGLYFIEDVLDFNLVAPFLGHFALCKEFGNRFDDRMIVIKGPT